MIYWKENWKNTYAIGKNVSAKIVYLKAKIQAWKRPSQLTKSPSLWGKKGIQATGIDQGALGDCYFLAALSALAEHP